MYFIWKLWAHMKAHINISVAQGQRWGSKLSAFNRHICHHTSVMPQWAASVCIQTNRYTWSTHTHTHTSSEADGERYLVSQLLCMAAVAIWATIDMWKQQRNMEHCANRERECVIYVHVLCVNNVIKIILELQACKLIKEYLWHSDRHVLCSCFDMQIYSWSHIEIPVSLEMNNIGP